MKSSKREWASHAIQRNSSEWQSALHVFSAMASGLLSSWVSFVSKVASLVLTKGFITPSKESKWAFVPELLAGVLRVTLIRHSRASGQGDEIHWLAQLRTLTWEQGTTPLFANPPHLYSFIFLPFLSHTPILLLRKPFLAWELEMKKGTSLSSNSQIFRLCLEISTYS